MKSGLFRLAAAMLLAGPVGAWAQDAAKDSYLPSFRALLIADTGYNGLGKSPAGAKMKSGFNLRRAQVGLDGAFGGGWTYNLGMIATGKGGTVDHRVTTYLQYADGPVGVRAGIFAAPDGIADSAGSANTLMLERPTAATISRGIAGSPSRATVTLFAQGKDYLAALSYTGGRIGTYGTLDEQQGVVGRLAWLAVHDDGVHWLLDTNIGHAFALRGPGGRPATVRLSDGPELSLDSARTVDTGNLDARAVTQWGVGTAGTWSNAYAEAAYFHFDVARRAVTRDADFSGWYVQASWSLTGDVRAYRASTATFGAPVPAAPLGKGGIGALDVTASYSTMDLNCDPLAGAAAGGVAGGAQAVRGLSLNWYPVAGVRASLVYQNARAHYVAAPARDIATDALVLRTQVAF